MSASKRSKREHLGYGKLILFGEHFVVKPFTSAIVAAVAANTTCTVEFSKAEWSTGLIIEDNRPAVTGYKPKKAEEMLKAIDLVLNHLKIDIKSIALKMSFAGDLCAVSGIGASAAQCVALARALNEALSLNLTEDQINETAYEGEKGYHGVPSGIDNTASTFGGLLRYQRTDKAPKYDVIPSKTSCRVVYASTGITSSTTEVVADVKAKREKNPDWYIGLEKQYVALYEKAEAAIVAGDWKQVGTLANECHTLLQDLSVSCKELDDLVNTARERGAMGAKLSGTGRGGLMYALCADKATEDKVYDALAKIAPDVWRTTFG